MNDYTRKILKAAGVRALHTMAQVAIATIGTAAVLEDVNWLAVLSATVLAGIISILKSIVIGTPETQEVSYDYIVDALEELSDGKEVTADEQQ